MDGKFPNDSLWWLREHHVFIVRESAEPRKLPFRIPARVPFQELTHFLVPILSSQVPDDFAIPNRLQGGEVRIESTGEQTTNLVDESGLQHRVGAGVDAGIEFGPYACEHDHVIFESWRTPLSMKVRERLAGGLEYLQRPNEAVRLRRIQHCCRERVDASQSFERGTATGSLDFCSDLLAHVCWNLRNRREPMLKRREVQRRAARNERQPTPAQDSADPLLRIAREGAGGVWFEDRALTDEVVRHLRQEIRAWLGRADFKLAKDLAAVRRDDFAPEADRDVRCERRLPNGGGPRDYRNPQLRKVSSKSFSRNIGSRTQRCRFDIPRKPHRIQRIHPAVACAH